MRIRNLYLALKGQLPWKRAFRNFFITRNAWGMFSKNSCINQGTGKPKISYRPVESAKKAAEKMSEKKGVHFSYYKCAYCDGYHIGKNKDNKIPKLNLGEPFKYNDRYFVILDSYHEFRKGEVPEYIAKEAYRLLSEGVRFTRSLDMYEGYEYGRDLVLNAYNGVYPGNGNTIKCMDHRLGMLVTPEWFHSINVERWKSRQDSTLYVLNTVIFEGDTKINYNK